MTEKDIYIDDYSDYYTGIETSYYNYTCAHAYISLRLETSIFLDEKADATGKEYNYIPLFDDSAEYDDGGWYDFILTVCEKGDCMSKDNVSITAERCNTESDDGEMFTLDLTEDEQKFLYDIVESYLKNTYGKSIQDFFKEEHAENVA